MPVPVVVLSHAHIAQAMLNSADEGRTLEVVRKGITVIDDEATQELVEIEKHDDAKLQRYLYLPMPKVVLTPSSSGFRWHTMPLQRCQHRLPTSPASTTSV